MARCSRMSLMLFLTVLAGCQLHGNDESSLLLFSTAYDFNVSDYGWVHSFADYPASPHDSALYELRYAYTDQIPGTNSDKKALMLSGKNLSKDLFMYLKKHIMGLKPNTEYTITFDVEMASDLSPDLVSGSSAVTSVYLKAGATRFEPKTVIESEYFVMNIDKGNQSTAGEDMTSLGEIVTPGNAVGYTIITRNNTMPNSRFVAKSNGDGELWLIIGTDSGFEGITTVYYTKINVIFSAS